MASYTSTQAHTSFNTVITVGGLEGSNYDPVAPTVIAFSPQTDYNVAAPTPGTRTTQTGPNTATASSITVSGLEGSNYDSVAPSVIAFSPQVNYSVAVIQRTRQADTILQKAQQITVSGLQGSTTDPVDPTIITMDAVSAGTGGVIPSSRFHTVEGNLIDADTGAGIDTANYLIAIGTLPVATSVAGSQRFSIQLLKQDYSDFILIGDSGSADYDLAWEGEPDNPTIEPIDTDADLEFDREQPVTGQGGLSLGAGIGLGG